MEVPSAVEWRLAHPPHQRLTEGPNRVSCAGHRSSPYQTFAQSHVHGSRLPLVLHGTGQSVGIPPLCLISPCVISTMVQTHGTKMYVIGVRSFARRHNLSQWIYRGDDWLFVRRWEYLLAHRHAIDIVQVISWNGEFSLRTSPDGS
jgi:hypothetical protein